MSDDSASEPVGTSSREAVNAHVLRRVAESAGFAPKTTLRELLAGNNSSTLEDGTSPTEETTDADESNNSSSSNTDSFKLHQQQQQQQQQQVQQQQPRQNQYRNHGHLTNPLATAAAIYAHTRFSMPAAIQRDLENLSDSDADSIGDGSNQYMGQQQQQNGGSTQQQQQHQQPLNDPAPLPEPGHSLSRSSRSSSFSRPYSVPVIGNVNYESLAQLESLLREEEAQRQMLMMGVEGGGNGGGNGIGSDDGGLIGFPTPLLSHHPVGEEEEEAAIEAADRILCGEGPENATVRDVQELLINLSGYMLWPFGKFIIKKKSHTLVFEPYPTHIRLSNPDGGEANEHSALLGDYDEIVISPEADAGPSNIHLSEPQIPIPPKTRSAQTTSLGLTSQIATEDQFLQSEEDPDSTVLTDDFDHWSENSVNMDHHEESGAPSPVSPVELTWFQKLINPYWKQWRRLKRAGLAGFLFNILAYLVLVPVHLLVTGCCFFAVVSVPMAKLNAVLLRHILQHPLKLSAHLPKDRSLFKGAYKRDSEHHDITVNIPTPGLGEDIEVLPSPVTPVTPMITVLERRRQHREGYGGDKSLGRLEDEYQIILCTHNAVGLQYYKYTYDGINIILINLNAVVLFTLFDFYYLGPLLDYKGIGSHMVIFCSALMSVVPLAYLIGMAVSSITAQTGNLALGAVVNATFGSIVEILLYCLALMEGKIRMVEGAIIGSFMAGLLALPGVSMFSGGLKQKEQRFNAKAAGVTSTMLIMAMIGAFGPTLFQQVYGTFELQCEECPIGIPQGFDDVSASQTASKAVLACRRCRYHQPHPTMDPIYIQHTRPLMYICASALVLVYAIGLLFTLHTHAKRIYPSANPEGRKSRSFSVILDQDAMTPALLSARHSVSLPTQVPPSQPAKPPVSPAPPNKRMSRAHLSGPAPPRLLSSPRVRPTSMLSPTSSPKLKSRPSSAVLGIGLGISDSNGRTAHGSSSNLQKLPLPSMPGNPQSATTPNIPLPLNTPFTPSDTSAPPSASIARPRSPVYQDDGQSVSYSTDDSGDENDGRPSRRGQSSGIRRRRNRNGGDDGRRQSVNRNGSNRMSQQYGSRVDFSKRNSSSQSISNYPYRASVIGTPMLSEYGGGGDFAAHGTPHQGDHGEEHGGHGGHDHPNWSAYKSAIVLLGATVLYSLIAEVLIASVDHVIQSGDVKGSKPGSEGGVEGASGSLVIDEKILGLTLFALVPTVTEFYNAIAFAQQGNIALSLEIGSAYTIQVALLQIPVLVAFSAYWRIFGHPVSSPTTPPAGSLADTTSSSSATPFSMYQKMFEPLVDWIFGRVVEAGSGFTASQDSHHAPQRTDTFTLVFPRWDLVAVTFSVFTLTYLYLEGKSCQVSLHFFILVF
ncbi:hypothetical protein HDU76_000971 [Blyttiomyces sp. JEL0837]|nr:hypothetical protein HDU76_000971 [Blyttiomyces sp. JEL0837]